MTEPIQQIYTRKDSSCTIAQEIMRILKIPKPYYRVLMSTTAVLPSARLIPLCPPLLFLLRVILVSFSHPHRELQIFFIRFPYQNHVCLSFPHICHISCPYDLFLATRIEF